MCLWTVCRYINLPYLYLHTDAPMEIDRRRGRQTCKNKDSDPPTPICNGRASESSPKKLLQRSDQNLRAQQGWPHFFTAKHWSHLWTRLGDQYFRQINFQIAQRGVFLLTPPGLGASPKVTPDNFAAAAVVLEVNPRALDIFGSVLLPHVTADHLTVLDSPKSAAQEMVPHGDSHQVGKGSHALVDPGRGILPFKSE